MPAGRLCGVLFSDSVSYFCVGAKRLKEELVEEVGFAGNQRRGAGRASVVLVAVVLRSSRAWRMSCMLWQLVPSLQTLCQLVAASCNWCLGVLRRRRRFGTFPKALGTRSLSIGRRCLPLFFCVQLINFNVT